MYKHVSNLCLCKLDDALLSQDSHKATLSIDVGQQHSTVKVTAEDQFATFHLMIYSVPNLPRPLEDQGVKIPGSDSKPTQISPSEDEIPCRGLIFI